MLSVEDVLCCGQELVRGGVRVVVAGVEKEMWRGGVGRVDDERAAG